MAINKQKILKDLKADKSAADTLRLEAVANVEKWRKEYNGEPYGNEEKGKSALVSRDIKRQDEWQHASVKEPFVADDDIIKCTPVTYEDREAARQNELIINYQFTRRFPRYKFMTDVVKLNYSDGTVIAKTSWEYEDKEVTEEMPILQIDPITGQPVQVGVQEVKKLKVIKNQPSAELCRIEDIFIDPTSQGNIDKAQFVIHRYETDLSSLRKAKKYKNLDKVARSLTSDGILDNEGDYTPEDDTTFKFQDNPRKKLVVYEYWGNYDINDTGIAEPIVCTWVNDIIIQLESNPYPDQAIPFVIMANNSTPFKIYGEGNAELIGDNQKVATAIKRGFIDNMANSNNGQKGIRVGALDTLNKKRFLNNKHFEFNGSREDLFEGSYNQIPSSAFQVLSMINNETESMLGVKSFSGGINGASLGNTATSARGALDAVSVRRLDIIRNIAENLLKPIIRKWIAYNSEFLSEEEVVRITNSEFVPIKKDDLKGAIDVKIHVSTAEDNAAKAQELAFMLQTTAPNSDPQEMRIIRAEIARLRKMPDLAKMIEEYQPQPDPLVQKERELQILKLEAEIAERKSRAMENQVDMRLKSAKAAVEETKARDIASGTDLKDLEFERKATGKEFNEEMVRKQHDRETQAEMKQLDYLTKQ